MGVRAVALVFIAIAVFMGVVTFVNVPSYTVYQTNGVITPGTVFHRDMVHSVKLQGVKPAPAVVGDDATLGSLDGTLVTSPIYPNGVLQSTSFYLPMCDPKGSFDPAKAAYATKFDELLCNDQRGIVIMGDPTSSFITVGDKIDLYFQTSGSDASTASVRKIMTKQVIFAAPVPALGTGDRPSGTAYVLNLSAQEAQDLIFAQSIGTLRIAIASPLNPDEIPTCESNAAYFAKTYKVTIAGLNGAAAPEVSVPSASPVPSAAGSLNPSASVAPSFDPNAAASAAPGTSAPPTLNPGC